MCTRICDSEHVGLICNQMVCLYTLDSNVGYWFCSTRIRGKQLKLLLCALGYWLCERNYKLRMQIH
jgi:hypothetical protein